MAAGYSGTPLAKKLGIKAGAVVHTHGAPANLAELLDPLPDGASVADGIERPCELALFFSTERAELESAVDRLGAAIFPSGALWVAWPKRASKVPTDITEDVVRAVILPRGLVDVKVCAIDAVWSGLKVCHRKENR